MLQNDSTESLFRVDDSGVSAGLGFDVAAPFLRLHTVSRDDCDGMGHVNNVRYLAWLERLAWLHSDHLGLPFAEYQRLGTGCVARRHELDYLAPALPGETLALATWIAENDGRASMTRAYQIVRVEDRRCVLRARTLWACVDLLSGRPRRQPPEFLAAYQPWPRA